MVWAHLWPPVESPHARKAADISASALTSNVVALEADPVCAGLLVGTKFKLPLYYMNMW